MDLFNNRYFIINKFFLTCTGLWPYQNIFQKYVMRTLVIILILIFLIPTVAGLCKVWGTVDLVVESLIPIITALGCLGYALTYMLHGERLRQLLDCIENDWKTFSSFEEIEILRSHGEDGRTLTLLYTGCVGLTAITYMLMTLSPQILNIILPLNETRPKQLPFPVEYFINYEENFNRILIHVSITTVIEICVLIGTKSTFTVLVEHACGLFSVVGLRLQSRMRYYNINQHKNWENEIYKDVIFCIEYQKRAIEFSESIESCFSTCFFFVTGANMILISTTLIQVVYNIDKYDNAIRFGAYTSGLIIELYFNNLPAQRLMDSSVVIADYIQDGLWYQMPSRSKKLLLMIIIRTRVPCTLSAGKMNIMSLNNFSSVLQTSFSFFTLLSSLRA